MCDLQIKIQLKTSDNGGSAVMTGVVCHLSVQRKKHKMAEALDPLASLIPLVRRRVWDADSQNNGLKRTLADPWSTGISHL